MKQIITEDYIIKLGQNAKENDIIVSQSDQTDLWFHLQNGSSPHLVLKCNEKYILTKEIKKICAGMVKEHSKYKHFKSIKVIYLECKYVRRTNKLGEVLLMKLPSIIKI